MTALPPSWFPRGRGMALAVTVAVAVVSGCGPTGDPADAPTPSPPPGTTPPPLPPPVETVPGQDVPGWPCPARTRLPDTVEVSWPVAAPAHRAAGPDGPSALGSACPPRPLRG